MASNVTPASRKLLRQKYCLRMAGSAHRSVDTRQLVRCGEPQQPWLQRSHQHTPSLLA